MSKKSQVARIDSSPRDDACDAYVESHPAATVYHLSAFRQAIEKELYKETVCLTARDQAESIIGVLPLAFVGNRIIGQRLVSMPYANYGGPLGASEEVEASLVAAAVSLADETGRNLELRDRQTRAGLNAIKEKVILELRLPRSAESLGKNLGSKRRSQIRRPMQENPEILHGGSELLHDFYEVFCCNMHDLGTPVYPYRFIAAVAESPGKKLHMVVLRIDDRPVAGAFLVGFRDKVEVPWAASLRTVQPLGINMLLYWEALTWAIEQGYSKFDFGRSTPGEGTYRFKRQWGAEPIQCYWNRWPIAEHQDGRTALMEAASRAWRRLPLRLANRIGPLISPNLPW